MTSEPTRSTVRPDGWVGDPAELERARRYRAFIKWGGIPFYGLIVGIWVLIFMGSPLSLVLVLVSLVWAVAIGVLQRRVGHIIGRKWSTWLEYKEGQQPQVSDGEGPVASWLSRDTDVDET